MPLIQPIHLVLSLIVCTAATPVQNAPVQKAAETWKRHTTVDLSLELPSTWKPLGLSDDEWEKARVGLDPRLAGLLADPETRTGFLWMAYDDESLSRAVVTRMNIRRRSFTRLDRATFESREFRTAIIKSIRDEFGKLGITDLNIDNTPLAKGVLSLTVESSSVEDSSVEESAGPENAVRSLSVQHMLLRFPHLWFLSFTGEATSAEQLRAVSNRCAVSFRDPDVELEQFSFRQYTLKLPKGWVAIDLTGRDFARERKQIADKHPKLVIDAIDQHKQSKGKLFAFAPETAETSTLENANLRRQRIRGLSDKRARDSAFIKRLEKEIRTGLTNAGLLIEASSRAPFGAERPGLRFDYLLRTAAGLVQGHQYVLLEPPYAWFLTFTIDKPRATQPRLAAFENSARSFALR